MQRSTSPPESHVNRCVPIDGSGSGSATSLGGMPAVTVVVAAYKAGRYLREAIESALKQSWSDLEVLVTDDAADPAVRELVESFQDPRLRYRSNPSRLGPCGNHWAGFAEARGRYLAILNHDDVWHPEFLAEMVAALERNAEAVLAFCDHNLVDGDGRVLNDATEGNSKLWGRSGLEQGLHRPFRGLAVNQSLPIAMAAVFRRDAIVRSDLLEVGPAYDLWLAYLLSRGEGAAWYTPRRLTGWRVHPSQLTGRADLSWSMGSLECWRAMLGDRGFRPFRRSIRKKLSQVAAAVAKASLLEGNGKRARENAFLAIRSNFANWQAWSLLGLCWLPVQVARRFYSKALQVGRRSES